MPYVQRNRDGEVTGLFEVPQPGTTAEFLPDWHGEVAAFRAESPTPLELLKPPSEKDIQRMAQDHQRIEREHTAIRSAVQRFNGLFSELEIALSALLHQTLNGPQHQLAYAIYFSPTSFHTRAEMITNVLVQLASKNKKLTRLIDLWPEIEKAIDSARNLRNAIAHSHNLTILVGRKRHVRLAPPAFDVLRLDRKIASGSKFGLTANDITRGCTDLSWFIQRIDDVNRLVCAFYAAVSLRSKFDALKSDLMGAHNPRRAGQPQQAP
jgi:hypothetical protein